MKTAEEFLKLSIGDLMFQLSVALARIEALEAELATLKAQAPGKKESP